MKITFRRALKKTMIFMFVLVILLATIAAANQRKSATRNNVFQPGDAIQISIIEIMDDQISKEAMSYKIDDDYSIDRDGTITLPLIGKVKVVGHNQESLVELLNEKFNPYFKEPFITVTPLIRLTLMGSFNKPGSYRIDPNESLWELIEMANGPTSDCNLNSLKVERSGKVVIKDLLSSFESGHSLEEIGVRSGDQIIASDKKQFGMREVLDWARFGVTLIVLYLQIDRFSN